MMRDQATLLSGAQTLTPAARTATAIGTTVDLATFRAATIYIVAGVRTDGTHTPAIQESTDGTTWTAVPAARLIGAPIDIVTNAVQEIGYIGALRFVRVTVTVAGATTGAVYGAIVVRGRPQSAPVV
ncbi:MAG: hypothetical protein DDT39_01653 [Firmicutes bacterium]|nr:hypothetical protein [candidate division NPL-UPA2 bacterium]